MKGVSQDMIARHKRLQTDKGNAAVVFNDSGACRVVVVCEHAGQAIPDGLEDLGLSKADLESHIAWDPGAAKVAEALAKALDAVLIKQRYSRLVYDCNRPPSSPDAMRETSENTIIPGNQNLSVEEKQWRTDNIYEVFHDCVADRLDGHKMPLLVTVHSFTPVFLGQVRDVDVGVLHDKDARLADAVLNVVNEEPDVFGPDVVVRRNEPYGPQDGVTHTLTLHADKRQILNVMIEIKNTLIGDEESQLRYGQQLAHVISKAISKLDAASSGGTDLQPLHRDAASGA